MVLIKKRVRYVFIIACMIVIFIISVSASVLKNTVSKVLTNQLLTMINNALEQQDYIISNEISDLLIYTETIAQTSLRDGVISTDNLEFLQNNDNLSKLMNVVIIDKSKREIWSTKEFDITWIKNNIDKFKNEGIYFDNKYSLMISSKAIVSEGENIGYAICMLHSAGIQKMLLNENLENIVDTSLVNSAGDIVISTRQGISGKHYVEALFDDCEINKNNIKKLNRSLGKDEEICFEYEVKGLSYYVLTKYNKTTGFTIITVAKESNMSDSIKKIRNSIWIPMAGFLFLAVGLGMAIVYYYLLVLQIKDKSNKELQVEKERYRVATEGMQDIIFEYNFKNNSFYVSSNLEEIYDIPLPSSIEEFETYIPNDDLTEYMKKKALLGSFISDCEEMDVRLRNRSGDYIWFRGTVRVINQDIVIERVVGKLVDITREKEEFSELSVKAMKDDMTQMYHKNATIQLIDEFLKNEGKNGKHAYYFIDIDNFKNINDTYGHQEGDDLIINLASRIREVFGKDEIIGRFGGDEFIVFVKNYKERKELVHLADLLSKKISDIAIDNMKDSMSITVGIACYPEDGITNEEIMCNADTALYAAKRAGKNQYIFVDSLKCEKMEED